MKLKIQHINASKIKVTSDDLGVIEDLYQTLRFKDPTFTPNKFSKWDGEIRMYDKKSGIMNYGLLSHLIQLAKIRGWSLEIESSIKSDLKPLTRESIQEWTNQLDIRDNGTRIQPYEYQVESLYLAFRYSRMTILAATSAGKSLIQYLMIRFYEQINPDAKILLVVPSINLVSQMKGDFKNYSTHNGWDAESKIHQVFEGASPHTDKSVVISTWQSLKDLDAEYFSQYTFLIVDECHLASAKCISHIGDSCINAYNRVGLTGTLKQDQLHPLQIQSHFGTIKRVVSTKQLQDSGRAAQTQINMINIDYPTRDRKLLFETNTYQSEIEFLIGHPKRNEIIMKLAAGLKGNTLFLFDRIDAHLKQIETRLRELYPDRKIYVINGEVDNKERDEIKRLIEIDDLNDAILLASYGTLSTGVSIKRLHNLVFCHPTKSIIRTLQSLGRLLRLHESKVIAKIYDFVDDLKYMNRPNHALRHALERYGYYKDEQHPVSSIKFKISEDDSYAQKILG